jgi:hypothetical protein
MTRTIYRSAIVGILVAGFISFALFLHTLRVYAYDGAHDAETAERHVKFHYEGRAVYLSGAESRPVLIEQYVMIGCLVLAVVGTLPIIDDFRPKHPSKRPDKPK